MLERAESVPKDRVRPSEDESQAPVRKEQALVRAESGQSEDRVSPQGYSQPPVSTESGSRGHQFRP